MEVRVKFHFVSMPIPKVDSGEGSESLISRPFDADVPPLGAKWQHIDLPDNQIIDEVYMRIDAWLAKNWIGLQFHRRPGTLQLLGIPADASSPLERIDLAVYPETPSLLAEIESWLGPRLVALGYKNRIGATSVRHAAQWRRT